LTYTDDSITTSKERSPSRVNAKKFEHQPTITLSYWTDGYNWVKLNKEVVSIPKGDKTTYYIPAGEEITITEKEIKRYESCRFNLFDTYKSVYFRLAKSPDLARSLLIF